MKSYVWAVVVLYLCVISSMTTYFVANIGNTSENGLEALDIVVFLAFVIVSVVVGIIIGLDLGSKKK